LLELYDVLTEEILMKVVRTLLTCTFLLWRLSFFVIFFFAFAGRIVALDPTSHIS